MIDLAELVSKIKNKQYEFSKHALDQSIVREISVSEMEQAILGNASIIENYPNDKYGPSCLIIGHTLNGRPLHVQCSHPNRSLVKIITLYQPNPEHWLMIEYENQNEEKINYEWDTGWNRSGLYH